MMGLLTMNCSWVSKAGGTLSTFNLSYGRKLRVHYSSPILLPAESCNKLRARTRVFASKKSTKKFRRKGDAQKNATALPDNANASDRAGSEDESMSKDASVQDNSMMSTDNLDSTMSTSLPSRTSVLQACTSTSILIAALGVTIRQLSHVASMEGWPIADCSTDISFGFQMWHIELITGLVVLVSSCRYLLLQTWPDFAESSEAANQQVLSSLQPLDYLAVASLSGFSEELLFRGTMLPLIGVNWKSALIVGIIFGVLHLGSGRKYSFAVCICWICLWLCYNFVLQHHRSHGFTRSKQLSRRHHMALHIKVTKINEGYPNTDTFGYNQTKYTRYVSLVINKVQYM
ncbi:uncharacterized protein LOC108206419 isoform X1 [Daucus carota subsp. sativus]|uniref:uncharacterized protein LOC108206419 isoform X1 n=1 Tax=Daucus carota subsp. sativus TaxID=79200 RepID=UPI0007F0299E|nr:PREDICTED: uncharacterized protein LOC108206419 isoform X1 [Daucus carota subsp. sativus]